MECWVDIWCGSECHVVGLWVDVTSRHRKKFIAGGKCLGKSCLWLVFDTNLSIFSKQTVWILTQPSSLVSSPNLPFLHHWLGLTVSLVSLFFARIIWFVRVAFRENIIASLGSRVSLAKRGKCGSHLTKYRLFLARNIGKKSKAGPKSITSRRSVTYFKSITSAKSKTRGKSTTHRESMTFSPFMPNFYHSKIFFSIIILIFIKSSNFLSCTCLSLMGRGVSLHFCAQNCKIKNRARELKEKNEFIKSKRAECKRKKCAFALSRPFAASLKAWFQSPKPLGSHVLKVLSLQSCIGVLSWQSWLSFSSCPVLAVLSRLSCPSCLVLSIFC
jgi:hypothetical protein